MTVHHDNFMSTSYCWTFKAKTTNGGDSGCSDADVYAGINAVIDNILVSKTSSTPMGDQTFDYDGSSSNFVVVTPNGFKDFFDVHADIENGVTCELLSNDCTNALGIGTEADGSTPLTTGPHISMSDQANSFNLKAEKNIATGYEYEACVKCKYESLAPSDRVAYDHEVTHTLTIK